MACVKILLAAGANALHKNQYGELALSYADDPAVCAVLRAHLEDLLLNNEALRLEFLIEGDTRTR